MPPLGLKSEGTCAPMHTSHEACSFAYRSTWETAHEKVLESACRIRATIQRVDFNATHWRRLKGSSVRRGHHLCAMTASLWLHSGDRKKSPRKNSFLTSKRTLSMGQAPETSKRKIQSRLGWLHTHFSHRLGTRHEVSEVPSLDSRESGNINFKLSSE